MEYWYLGIVIIAIIAGIIYFSRRGSIGKIAQDSNAIGGMPIKFGYTDELRFWRAGKLLVLEGELIIIDDKDVEQLHMTINQDLQIALRNYDPLRPPFWDIKDHSSRTLRFEFKTSFSPFFMNAIADCNERLLDTIRQVTGTETVRVMAIARPSFMRMFEVVRWVVIGVIFLVLVFVLYQN